MWDVARSKVFVDMREHERRVWAVDFSITDPTKLASGSDDGTVKLWNINKAIPLLHFVYVVGFEPKRHALLSFGILSISSLSPETLIFLTDWEHGNDQDEG